MDTEQGALEEGEGLVLKPGGAQGMSGMPGTVLPPMHYSIVR